MSASQAVDLPMVTVIMPVYNEEAFIGRSLSRILAQDYPDECFEVIVVDGQSTDRTRSIVEDYIAQDPRISLIENTQRLRGCALNLAIPLAQGDVIVLVDGHCEVSDDFMREGVALLDERPEVWCVGGPTRHVGETTFARAVAVAMSNVAGVGTATHRFENFEGYSDGVQFPAVRKWVFDRVGLFDEKMVRTEDDDFTFRVRQAGGKVYVSPRIRYIYFVRDSLRKLWQQYFQYGFWRVPMIQKHKRPTTVRQMVPLLFCVAVTMLFIAGIALGQPVVALALPAIYLSALTFVAVVSAFRIGPKAAMFVPLAMLTMHTAYAFGMAWALATMLFWSRSLDTTGSMSQQVR